MLECPKCKTNEFTNRSLVMLINECGHPLCKNCVENIFVRNQNYCPYEGCGRVLKKSNFWEQIFEDPRIERETYIRRRLSKVYNLQEDDFSSLDAFNDYLENFEEIVARLVDEDRVDEVEAEIKTFADENAERIERNKRRLNPDELWINQMLDEEANRAARLQEDKIGSEEDSRRRLVNQQRSIISELKDSDLPAEILLDQHRKQQIEVELTEKEKAELRKRQKQERLRHDRIFGGPVRVSGKPYIHVVPEIEINGPRMPILDELESIGFFKHAILNQRAIVGGLTPPIAYRRALIDARMDLFVL